MFAPFFSRARLFLFQKFEKKNEKKTLKTKLERFVHKLRSLLNEMCVVGVILTTICMHMMTKLNCLLRLDETLYLGAFF